MKKNLHKLAAVLAFIIGAMAVFAGGKVLLGNIPDYYVIDWLPVYNYTMGIITVFTTTALIWTNSRMALPAAWATFSLHAAVMLVLRSAYSSVVAVDSLVAMTVRLIIWIVILVLLLFQGKRNKVLS
ncbi:hypothetical protein KQH40_01295 [bacterium]|nr:hypothetical protein [bacterium]